MPLWVRGLKPLSTISLAGLWVRTTRPVWAQRCIWDRKLWSSLVLPALAPFAQVCMKACNARLCTHTCFTEISARVKPLCHLTWCYLLQWLDPSQWAKWADTETDCRDFSKELPCAIIDLKITECLHKNVDFTGKSCFFFVFFFAVFTHFVKNYIYRDAYSTGFL